MLKKFISILILISMTLHGSGRFELLSYLYQQRHSIAHSVGFISEIPIAICSSDYDFGSELKLDANEDDQRMPGIALANEINLFFVSAIAFPDRQQSIVAREFSAYNSNNYRLMPIRGIFHPPTA